MTDTRFAFEQLVRSTVNLHERFNTQQTPAQALARLLEEIDEVRAEIEVDPPYDYPLACELADVIVTVLGLAIAAEIGPLFGDAMLAVAHKNNAKTHDTHFVRDDGKIARRDA